MSKRIQVSDDAGSNWYTLPGNKGELTREGVSIKDTIYGRDFQSDMTGLINWTISANGLFKGYAGYVAKILKSGSTTAMTDEAMTLVSGKTYKITAATKNVWDRSVTPTFEDGGSPIDPSDIASIDYLFGRVTLDSGYTPSGAITVATGSYLPMTQVAKAQTFTLTQTANTNDNTNYETAQSNSGHKTFELGLRTVSLSLRGVYASSNAYGALLIARNEVVIEINPDGSGKSVARGWFRANTTGQSGDVGDLEEENLNFVLNVPDQEDITIPFKWVHTSTTLSTAVQKALTAWEDGTSLLANYLPDGTNGVKGTVYVTDISLAGGLEAMNDFTVKLQGSGALSAVP